ncbi:WD40-repeat-containing domain protein [Coprinopsis sp. MPI-PUGE-AT-0042]|nr:WD40-repeat-containing domain protein [Coprinopsis sp. MPI-PUGE-AT-0042]
MPRMASDTAQTVPVVTVQPSISEVLQEVQDGVIPSDKFWVSCYRASETSVHSKITAELDEVDRDLVNLSSDDRHLEFGFKGNGKHGHSFTASCDRLGISDVHIHLPVQEYEDSERTSLSRPQRITAFDVSPDVSRYATGYTDGGIFLYPVSPVSQEETFLTRKVSALRSEKVAARPHVSEVTSLRFFPSSRVLLSSGLDFALSILPADLPEGSTGVTKVEPARTLRGHKRSITGTAIVDVGRNVLSSSLDATVKLWDVAGGSSITTIHTASSSPVLSIAIGSKVTESVGDISFVATEDPAIQSKALFCGLQNGSFELLDLSTKASVYRSATSSTSPIRSIAYMSESHLLATGASKGLVTIYDVRSLEQPLTSFVRQDGEVTDLAFLSESRWPDNFGLAISTSDGLPFVARLSAEGTVMAEELIGVDCDPVRNVRVRRHAGKQEEIWLSSDDGVVRRYRCD